MDAFCTTRVRPRDAALADAVRGPARPLRRRGGPPRDAGLRPARCRGGARADPHRAEPHPRRRRRTRFTASFGLTVMTPDQPLNEAVRTADAALLRPRPKAAT